MDELLVALTEVAVRDGARTRFGPLSLAVAAGEFIGVAGPNGAGKSTLLALLAGALAPSSGRRDARVAEIGTLLQHHEFVPDLPFTVEDVVLLGRLRRARPARRLTRTDREAAAAAVAELGLEELRTRSYRTLSGGEQRKVHLARLVAQGARLLLLDEPTASLDPDWQERLTGLIAALHERHGAAVVMVTHDIARLPACCDRVVLLRGGREVAAGRPEAVLTESTLSALYACPMEVVERHGRRHAFARGEAP